MLRSGDRRSDWGALEPVHVHVGELFCVICPVGGLARGLCAFTSA